jgi:hypothetical protein
VTTPRSCDSILAAADADGVDGAHPLAQQGRQHGVGRALVLAAEDEMNAATEGGDGLGGGVHVGGLGVVVELDAVAGGHVLQAMLDGLEVFDGAANGIGRDAGRRAATTAASTFSKLCAPLRGIPLRALRFPMAASGAER